VFTTSTLKGPLLKFYVPNGFKCTIGFNESNVGVQFLSTDNVTCAVVPTPAALQSPPQPPKVDPVSGSSVSCTGGIGANGALCVEHLVPQLIPAGTDVTVPVPLPLLEILKWKLVVNEAVQTWTALTVT